MIVVFINCRLNNNIKIGRQMTGKEQQFTEKNPKYNSTFLATLHRQSFTTQFTT